MKRVHLKQTYELTISLNGSGTTVITDDDGNIIAESA